MTFRVGTRRSPLAQAQTDRVLAKLPPGAAEKVIVESEGDLDKTSPLHRMERPGAFTAVLTDAILAGHIDAAVHSLKDLPLVAPAEAPLVAILARDDPADVLLVRDDARDPARPLGLKAGSRVGTSAPRRQTQVLAADPELVPLDVRGNVGTRLNLLAVGVVDGLLMAAAAFERMTLPLPAGVTRTRLDPATYPPGPGQGAVAVQARAGSEAARVLATLDAPATREAVELERRVLGALGGGCGMPLGAYAYRTPRGWSLSATLAPDEWEGMSRVPLTHARVEARTPREALEGCMTALAAPPPQPALPTPTRIALLTLPPISCEAYRETFAQAGWRALAWELISVAPTGNAPPEDAARAGWIAVSSPRAAPYAARFVNVHEGPAPRVAALGPATARALRASGLPVHVLAPEGTGAALAEAIAAFPAEPAPVLIPQATRPMPDLQAGLEARGFETLPWAVYDTRKLPSPAPIPAGAEALVLTSPSNVEALVARGPLPSGLRLVAFGPTTETAMRAAGLPVHATARRRSPSGILEVLS